MPRALNSKVTYRCTKQQHDWLNAYVAEHNTTTQNLINGIFNWIRYAGQVDRIDSTWTNDLVRFGRRRRKR